MQRVVHDLPKIYFRLVYHQKLLTQIFEEGFENRIHQDLKC
jgi:hypothetical protein